MPAYPLGSNLTGSPHSVCLSLPTMGDVIGYETCDSRVHEAIRSGYPRFVEHTWIRQLTAHLAHEAELPDGERLVLTGSERGAELLAEFCGAGEVDNYGGLVGVRLSREEALAKRVRRFLQHTGYGISSREAEDTLVSAGLLPAAFGEEISREADPAAFVRGELARHMGADVGDILFTRSGMNAFFAAYQAISKIQALRGRTRWVQLGWLYLDTIEVLRAFAPEGSAPAVLPNAEDTAAFGELLASDPSIAAVVVEVPTNPRLQVPDLPALRKICLHHGVALVADPTLASICNLDVLPQADAVVTSLTKYAACEGDVMAGLLVFNRASAFTPEVGALAQPWLAPPYGRDLARLAVQIGGMEAIARRSAETSAHLAERLRDHPGVAEVYAANPARLQTVANPGAAGAGVFSLVPEVPLAPFYDALEIAKSPSFGLRFTMACPFLYLAHYDLVSTEAGRAYLGAHGLSADLLRISCGMEAPEELINVFLAALAHARRVAV